METPAQTYFRSIYAPFLSRQSKATDQRGLMACLSALAMGYPNLKLDPKAPELYGAVLDPLMPDELIQAFARASSEEWFPSPGRLLVLSGRSDALEAEALRHLRKLAEALHEFPLLRSRRGPLLYEGRDGEGGPYLPENQRQYGESTAPPAFESPVRDTITAMGDGDFMTGILRITPGVVGILGLVEDQQSTEARVGQNIKRSWIDNYRRIRG